MQYIFVAKLNDSATSDKNAQQYDIMCDKFLERVGNHGEKQIQDSRIRPDILRNILSGVYTIT